MPTIKWGHVAAGLVIGGLALAAATGKGNALLDFEQATKQADAINALRAEIKKAGCNRAIALDPNRNRPDNPAFVNSGLLSGAMVTVGGLNGIPFTAGSLICDETGVVGRVNTNGLLVHPFSINPSDPLPNIAVAKKIQNPNSISGVTEPPFDIKDFIIKQQGAPQAVLTPPSDIPKLQQPSRIPVQQPQQIPQSI